jgi:anhydro-N-acetylmuramic acid kinase
MREDAPQLFIGLMSGTSLDGVDGVLARFAAVGEDSGIKTLATAHVNFSPELHAELLALQHSGADEIHREALAGNLLAGCYAACVEQLLSRGYTEAQKVLAIGAHGQTIRHRPELGYTRQINNGALLAELTGIDVITDFRSRDIAAGGQGAPLVPLFHQQVFGTADQLRVIVNIGGISNISVVPEQSRDSAVIGFDTGPGNGLLDVWIQRHLGLAYDAAGNWASSGVVNTALLQTLRDEPFFSLAPPKSTGRDLFNAAWLDHKLVGFTDLPSADVQATLTELTATTLADAVQMQTTAADTVYLCGGGAFNTFLLKRIEAALRTKDTAITVLSTAALGVPPDQVEALAFAWLAQRFMQRKPGNIPAVTGASGGRICGALYPR